jgi:UDP-N-acetylmuramoylalanine--D-glutamate ligase
MNALAAIATAHQAGASVEACVAVLAQPMDLAHRVQFVGAIDDVSYYDDSKATTPSAVIAALAGFSSVVLIAGGKNKGLDLSTIARSVATSNRPLLQGVVAIGEAAPEVAEAFGAYPVATVASMEAAVDSARSFATPGDAVLLSPGCASFDWYRSYEERGEDFARIVRDRMTTPKGDE